MPQPPKTERAEKMATVLTRADVSAPPTGQTVTGATDSAGAREVLVFEVGGQTYGLPTADVRELVRAVAITPLPGAPGVIEGVVNVGVILRVDRATHLALVDEGSVQAPETLGPAAAYVSGVARLEDGLVLIHDLTSFLSAAESEALDEALRAPASP
jgi:purine-binding chemotaxis protein CheW